MLDTVGVYIETDEFDESRLDNVEERLIKQTGESYLTEGAKILGLKRGRFLTIQGSLPQILLR